MSKPKPTSSSDKISIRGKTVAVTGALPGMNRSQVQSWIIGKHASYSPIVDRNTSYLIVGKSSQSRPSTKLIAAQNLRIVRLNYKDIE
jgi:NAD-dependent DNA ligase